jgi:NodT family efflux transporter outer membrane factor (OMF) lipoprotein
VSRAAARARSALGLGAAGMLLAGCVAGPRYVPPAPPAPSTQTFAAAAPAAASADQPPPDWWRLYDVPALDQLVEQALTHNKSLLVAAADLSQARAALSLAQAGRFPSTDLSASAQYGVSPDQAFANHLQGLGPASPGPVYAAGLDVSYEVDLFGRVRRTLQAAGADAQAQQAAEDVVRVSVAGETTRAYVDACAYAEQLAVAKQSLELVTETYEITAKEARDGAASDLDVARAREQVARTRASLPTYEGLRRTALFELAVLTGQPPEQISQAADACTSPPKLNAVLPVGDVRSLFRRRPDVREAERRLAGDVARIGVATADLYPTITLGASAGNSAGGPGGLGSQSNLTYALGPLLSWSFPNTLAAQARIREARAGASASYASFQAAVLQALRDVEAALTAYANELDRNTALAAARDQSLAAFKLATTQHQRGRVSYLDLLTAQTDLVSAGAALAASDQALASDQVTVFKALGGGWEQAPPVTPAPIADGRAGESISVR